ncbi:rhodanese-like domain-containing protein [Gallaecimonas sp. GXIMD1310]|uniref:rhodanese-like domain-containing protein n=1 Tax=Gallaecimonas sp. GXIMD1310 TaxID=3131926 RepID=UPI0032448D8E
MNSSELLTFLANHPYLTGGWVVLFLLLVWSLIQGATSKVKAVSAQQAVFLMNQDNSVVVDIRASADFRKNHIAGAMNVSREQILKGDLKNLEKHKDDPIIVVCNVGQSAKVAASQLDKAGYNAVYVLTGGMQGWQDAGMPVKG